jgi:hypothetical protein
MRLYYKCSVSEVFRGIYLQQKLGNSYKNARSIPKRQNDELGKISNNP